MASLSVVASGAASWWGATPARAAGTVSLRLAWTQTVPAGIKFSSPTEATLDGSGPSVVVGSSDGHVYAFHLADGSAPAGWSGGVKVDSNVDSTPSSARLGGDSFDTVFVGTGQEANPAPGTFTAITASGSVKWAFSGTSANPQGSVLTSLALAPLTCSGALDAVSGSTGFGSYAVDAASGSPLPGWPVRNYDTVWSSPAIAPVGGQNIVVEGDDSTSPDGGWLRAFDGSGHTLWQDQFDDVTTSSPAVGAVDSSGRLRAAVGHGFYWSQTTGTTKSSATQLTLADAATGAILWNKDLGGYTRSSPALADVAGTGTPAIVEGTQGSPSNPNAGEVWVVDGTGNPLPNWPQPTPSGWGAVYGDITSADLSGSGYQDLMVPTGAGLAIYDGRSGQAVATAGNESGNNLGLQNAALVAADPGGALGLTIAGTDHAGHGEIRHYTVTTPGATVGTKAWPAFHHDSAQTGSLTAPNAHPAGCGSVQAGGYRMVASDGGIFDFGNAAFYGSEGASPGSSPVVGMAPTPDGHGYWIASADGTVRAYGDATFHGDRAGSGARMVGIAPTPDGAGYWLADSYGGIYTFGTAGYYGNGGQTSEDVVGMAPSPDGHGYWIVTNAGAVIACGDSASFGDTSAMHLNAPVLGVAPTNDGRGYWIIAQDGGIFSYGDAHFYGSTGSMHLNAPVVGMTPTPTGAGYWLVASDGGIFTFGDAQFYGSMGGQRLNAPVIAMTSGG